MSHLVPLIIELLNVSLNLRKEQCNILGGEAEELVEENTPKKVHWIVFLANLVSVLLFCMVSL